MAKKTFIYKVYLQPFVLDGTMPSVEVRTTSKPSFNKAGFITFGEDALFNKMLVRNIILEGVE